LAVEKFTGGVCCGDEAPRQGPTAATEGAEPPQNGGRGALSLSLSLFLVLCRRPRSYDNYYKKTGIYRPSETENYHHRHRHRHQQQQQQQRSSCSKQAAGSRGVRPWKKTARPIFLEVVDSTEHHHRPRVCYVLAVVKHYLPPSERRQGGQTGRRRLAVDRSVAINWGSVIPEGLCC
jgi:hypothetical protein